MTAPPMSDPQPQKPTRIVRPALVVLGFLSAAPLGLALLILLTVIADRSLSMAWLTFAVSVGISSFLWLLRYRNPQPVNSYGVGVLFGVSFTQVLIAFVLVLRFVPKDTPAPLPRLTSRSTRTLSLRASVLKQFSVRVPQQ